MAGPHNFVVKKGETWNRTVSASVSSSAVDHTGYTVEMDVRASPVSSSELLTLTLANSRVTINGSGNIQLALTAAETAALTFDRGFYDLKVTSPGGTVNYYLEGQFIVEPSVTR